MEKRETELYCHGCNNEFTAELDMDINGNHEIECPYCGHIHYRVVEDGQVTDDRYRSSMGMVRAPTFASSNSNNASSAFLCQAWSDTSSSQASLRTSGSS